MEPPPPRPPPAEPPPPRPPPSAGAAPRGSGPEAQSAPTETAAGATPELGSKGGDASSSSSSSSSAASAAAGGVSHLKTDRERRAAAVAAASVAAFPVVRRLSSQVVSKTAQRALAAGHYFNHARGDWVCVICGSANFSDRSACMLCQSKRPAPGDPPLLGTSGAGGRERKAAGGKARKSDSGTARGRAERKLKTPHWHADAIFLHWWKRRVVNFIGKDIMRLQHQRELQQQFASANSSESPSELAAGSSSTSSTSIKPASASSASASSASASSASANSASDDSAGPAAASSASGTASSGAGAANAQTLRAQLETSARYESRDDFNWRLDNFLEQRYRIKRRELILGGEPLDLHLLYKAVLARGGFRQMATEAEKTKGVWASVFRSLPNFNENETSASFRLRKIYEKYLHEFELSERGIPLPRRVLLDKGSAGRKRKRDEDATGSGASAQKKSAPGVRTGVQAPAPAPPDPGASKQDEGEASRSQDVSADAAASNNEKASAAVSAPAKGQGLSHTC